MISHDQTIQVKWQFPVRFTRGVFAPGNPTLNELILGDRPRVLAYLDANLVAAHPALPEQLRAWAAAHPHGLDLALVRQLPGGEAVKNDPTLLTRLAADARDYHLCRHSYVMAIGGGALLDAVGFATASIHRGCRLLRLPSTVLAQNDSGMGVKNSINFMGLKNFLGTFAPPAGVVCDFDLLATLPWRIWVSGVAEAFKVGIIKDAEFLAELIAMVPALRRREALATERMITRTAELHLRHIAGGGDPFESGSSRPLDFGHWSAHKLESLSKFRLLHGEAVSIGMALDLQVAADLGFIPRGDAQRLCQALHALGLPVWHPLLQRRQDDLLHGLHEFQEHLGGRLTLAMPCPLGQQRDLHALSPEQVRAAIAALAPWAKTKPRAPQLT